MNSKTPLWLPHPWVYRNKSLLGRNGVRDEGWRKQERGGKSVVAGWGDVIALQSAMPRRRAYGFPAIPRGQVEGKGKPEGSMTIRVVLALRPF